MGKKFLIVSFTLILALVTLPGVIFAKVQKKAPSNKVKAGSLRNKSNNSGSVKNLSAASGNKPAAATETVPGSVNYVPAISAYIQPSTYYLMPGQNFTVSGAYYLPGEKVDVLAAGVSRTVTADNGGNFTAGQFSLSAGDVLSTVEITATGKSSGVVRKAELKVGTYYPTVTPSSYYLPAAGRVTFNGSHFAPGEKVIVTAGKQVLAAVPADTSGNFNYDFMMAGPPGSKQFAFTGEYTQSAVKVEVKLGY